MGVELLDSLFVEVRGCDLDAEDGGLESSLSISLGRKGCLYMHSSWSDGRLENIIWRSWGTLPWPFVGLIVGC